jgi:hypothetical protein
MTHSQPYPRSGLRLIASSSDMPDPAGRLPRTLSGRFVLPDSECRLTTCRLPWFSKRPWRVNSQPSSERRTPTCSSASRTLNTCKIQDRARTATYLRSQCNGTGSVREASCCWFRLGRIVSTHLSTRCYLETADRRFRQLAQSTFTEMADQCFLLCSSRLPIPACSGRSGTHKGDRRA